MRFERGGLSNEELVALLRDFDAPGSETPKTGTASADVGPGTGG